MIISKPNLHIGVASELQTAWKDYLGQQYGIFNIGEIYSSELSIYGDWDGMVDEFEKYVFLNSAEKPVSLSYYHGPGWRLWNVMVHHDEYPVISMMVVASIDSDVEAVKFKLAMA